MKDLKELLGTLEELLAPDERQAREASDEGDQAGEESYRRRPPAKPVDRRRCMRSEELPPVRWKAEQRACCQMVLEALEETPGWLQQVFNWAAGQERWRGQFADWGSFRKVVLGLSRALSGRKAWAECAELVKEVLQAHPELEDEASTRLYAWLQEKGYANELPAKPDSFRRYLYKARVEGVLVEVGNVTKVVAGGETFVIAPGSGSGLAVGAAQGVADDAPKLSSLPN